MKHISATVKKDEIVIGNLEKPLALSEYPAIGEICSRNGQKIKYSGSQ
jgi:hypothetical protein